MLKKVRFSSTLVLTYRRIFIVILIIIAAFIVDTSLIKISLFSISHSLSNWRIAIFVVIAIIYAVGQYMILKFIKNKNKEFKTGDQTHLNAIHKIVEILQYVLIVFLFFVIFQIIVMSRYNIVLLGISTGISYSLSIAILGLLTQRFISWLRITVNHVVLLYSLTSAMLVINAIFTLIFVMVMLLNLPPYVRIHVSIISPPFASDPVVNVLNYMYVISSVISYILAWSATALLMHHHSRRLGRIKYWVIVGTPLIYFLIQFEPFYLNLLLSSFRQEEPIIFGIVYTLIFSASKPIGGVLFGIAFWTIARTLSHSRQVRDYMIISAYGFVLLFVSNQAIVLLAGDYPPFGLPTISFMSVSSYLILLGIYSSAVSVAQDLTIRQSIRKLAVNESSLLDSIGTAQMETELQKRVVKIVNEHASEMETESGVQTSLTEEEIKQYVGEVLEEINRTKSAD